ncbi:hypothetical protein AV530_019575 [Patagioenas fasciata monilis]|uniref:Uncharacterized protein n=1 Tax=Patagioenas fasciata monilis TaxID=372326 RepID=A0A1V4JE33_PATFA|nr:hypothetical protein AV530_019575 [Patagioenas fasciata monilis]
MDMRASSREEQQGRAGQLTSCLLKRKESTAHLSNAQIVKPSSGHNVLVLLLAPPELLQDKVISTERMHS